MKRRVSLATKRNGLKKGFFKSVLLAYEDSNFI